MASSYCSDSPAKTNHFLKIILSHSDLHSKLMIPRKFVRKHRKNMHDHIFLKAPNGLVWPVNLESHKGKVWLQNGWPEFARFYSIHFGHVLVFEYGRNFNFQVRILHPSGAEIDYPLTRSANLNLGESTKVRKRTEIEDSTSSDLIRPHKKTIANFARKDSRTSHNGVCLMPKLQQEKTKGNSGSAVEEAKARAKTFKSNKPFFVLAMKQSHVDGKRRGLVIRKAFEENYKIWKNDEQIHLQVAGKTWLVNCDMKWNRCRMSCGWDRFAQDNSLNVGDVCVFELINASTKLLQVLIFQAAEETKCKGNKRLPRVRSEAEEARLPPAFASVNAFKSKYPFFIVKVYPSYVHGGSMSLPKKFIKRYISKESCNVILQISDGRCWSVKCNVYNTCAKFNVGWMIFARANKLAAGDVCAFELINCLQNLMNVVIFRARSSDF